MTLFVSRKKKSLRGCNARVFGLCEVEWYVFKECPTRALIGAAV